MSQLRSALLALLIVMLAACNQPTTQEPTPVPVTPTAEPSATTPPTEEPTATAEPTETVEPTETAEPTEEPEPTDEPTPTEEAEEEEEETSEEAEEVTLSDDLYNNPEFGLTWETPDEEWEFAPFDEAAAALMPAIVAPLASLQSVDKDDERILLLSALDLGGPTLSQTFAAELEANPEATMEQIASQFGLPTESVEQTEVGGQPAILARIEDGTGATTPLWIVIAPQALLYVVGTGFEDEADATALLETLTFAEVEMAEEVAEEDVDPEQQRADLVDLAEELRELETQESVPFELMSRDDLRAELEADIEENVEPEEIEAEEALLKLLGLIPEDTDLLNLTLDLYESQIAGFYDPEENIFFLISEGAEGEPLGVLDRVTFVHEYVHALQDQHYDLQTFTEQGDEDRFNDDEALARLALVEGDAQTATFMYIINHLSASDAVELAEASGELDSETLEQTPAYLRESLIFPYTAGQLFVQSAQMMGSWDDVNEIWENPPLSTEQILHPERYPDDVPVEVELPADFSAALGEGWTEALRDVWGEFGLLLTLQDQNLDAEEEEGFDEAVATAAEGWGGDSYLYLTNGERGVFVMEMAWDTEEDAAEAFEAWQGWLADAGLTAGEGNRLTSEGRAAYLRTEGDRVYLALANDDADLTTALTQLGWE